MTSKTDKAPSDKAPTGKPSAFPLTNNYGVMRHQFLSEITNGIYSFRKFAVQAGDIIGKRRGKGYKAFESIGAKAKKTKRGIDALLALSGEMLSIYTSGKSQIATPSVLITDADRAADRAAIAKFDALYMPGYDAAVCRLSKAIKSDAGKFEYVHSLDDGIAGVLIHAAGLEGYIAGEDVAPAEETNTHPFVHTHIFNQSSGTQRVTESL